MSSYINGFQYYSNDKMDVKCCQWFMSRIFDGFKVMKSYINGVQHKFKAKKDMSSFVNGLC